MELEEGLGYASQGRAILFLGAGFSYGATSLSGEKFLLGPSLAEALAGEIGISNQFDLQDIADIYLTNRGSSALLSKLRGFFTAKEITPSQREVAKIPWRIVYTTNYDDVLERSCAEIGKQVVSISGVEQFGVPNRHALTCVHLNGFIRTATEASLTHDLKLTGTSYASGSSMNDEWADRFRFDLHAAQAIFFVGYSLADLDLKRVLLEEELSEKSFFVMKPNPSLADAHRASRYGLIVDTGVDAFAKSLSAFSVKYVAPTDPLPISHCIKRYTPTSTDRRVEDRHILELLLSGKLRQEYIPQSFTGRVTYCGVRTAVERIGRIVEPGIGVVFVHSALGNGKTVALEEAKYLLSAKGLEVYTLSDRGDTLAEELHLVLQGEKHKVIFIDNYVEWLDILSIFRGQIGLDLTLVMSARTSSHEALSERVSESLGSKQGYDLNLDELDDSEMRWVAEFVGSIGFWKDRAGDGIEEKIGYLKTDCASQWSSILLDVFESPQILAKLESIFDAFKKSATHQEPLLRLLILTVLGYHPNSPTVITLCGEELLSLSFRQDPLVRELIDVGKDSFNMRSSVMAQVILKKITDPNRTVRAVIALIAQVDKLANGSTYHWELFKNLVRFSNSHLFFPEECHGRSAMQVYEAVKVYSNCQSNPLFWLQYAIAALVSKDFERSYSYFRTSYSLAGKLEQYDSFQIDNHYARFLLERAIAQDFNSSDRMAPFREARALLRPQFAEEWRDYPYRVATRYYDFFMRFAKLLTVHERQEIVGAADEVLDRIEHLPPERRTIRSIRECLTAQRRIIEAFSAN